MKQKTTLRKTALAALMAALITVFTIVAPVPLPSGGFANLGDCFVILAAFLLGPVFGGLAAAIGAALSDLILGFGIYAPATFVIKFFMAAAAAMILKKAGEKSKAATAVLTFLAALSSEVIMIGGYFLYECLILTPAAAAVDILGNAVQGGVGIAASLILFTVLVKTKVFRQIKKGLAE